MDFTAGKQSLSSLLDRNSARSCSHRAFSAQKYSQKNILRTFACFPRFLCLSLIFLHTSPKIAGGTVDSGTVVSQRLTGTGQASQATVPDGAARTIPSSNSFEVYMHLFCSVRSRHSLFSSLLGVALLAASGALTVTPSLAAVPLVLYQASSASTDMGTSVGSINNVINQSALSTPYVSGTTSFFTYAATHDSSITFSTNRWVSAQNTTTGNVIFDLGQSHTLSGLAFWNLGSANPSRVVGFDLQASNDETFSSATNLGSFTSTPTGTPNAVNEEKFSFTPVTARYVRMTITSNGGNTITGFGEAALVGTAEAPEPGSLSLLGMAGLGMAGTVIRRRKAA